MKKGSFTLYDGKIRFSVVCVLVGFVFLAVCLRLAYLQLLRGEELGKMAERQVELRQRGNTPRGRIVDRNGAELASSIMAKTLTANPYRIHEAAGKGMDVAKAAGLLAPVLGMRQAKLYEILTDKEMYFRYVKRSLEPKEYQAAAKIIAENKFAGFNFIEESKRYYVKKNVAAQVLGFVGDDDIGRYGIELELDSILRGARTFGSQRVDAEGRPIVPGQVQSKEEIPLATVHLTLDSKMQYILEDAMDDALVRTHAVGAAAIIMDPYTGEILGMVSRPTFDPNEYWRYPQNSWLNKTISMVYEPGSVFKPIVGCAGLSEGIVTPDTVFQDDGSIRIADRVIHNWDNEGKGPVPFSEVIKFSINTGMVQLGMQLKAKRLIDYSKRFGFGRPTGIDLPGEESGILYDPDEMYDPDVATMAIGQGIAITPLQALRAISAIANGGELLQPYIIKKVTAPNGEVIKEGKKKVVRSVITPQVAAQMRDMMEKVVSEGGGKTAAIKGYRIAGKTGTAEKLAEEGGYAAGKYIASFVGFVPADKPVYAMIVILDTPKGAFYGSQVSAPIFRDTLQQILVAKGIQPQDGSALPSLAELSGKNKSGPLKEEARPLPRLQLLPDGRVRLPDCTGIDLRYAAELLQQGQLRLKPYGHGRAYKQQPAAGSIVQAGSTVEIWFR